MSLANKITIGRAALIPGILVLAVYGQRTAALVLFLIACAGDVLDGLAARARGEITTWGTVLDPIVDKILYFSVVVVLAVQGDLPLLALVLYLIPQIGLGLGAIALRRGRRVVQGSRWLGKGASLVTFVGIVFLLVGWPGGIGVFYGATAATYVAAIDYARSGCRLQASSS